jgi:Ser/Thr protein kinase RdoA (MazF antagonist)
MPVFHTAKSFLSTSALEQCISTEYGLENVSCRLSTCYVRDVYEVTADTLGPHSLYVYRSGTATRPEVESEWQVVDGLAAVGIPMTTARPRRDGQRVLEFDAPEGKRYGVLAPTAPGPLVRSRMTPSTVRAFGRTLASMHEAWDRMPEIPSRPENEIGAILDRSVAAFAEVVPERRDDIEMVRRARDLLLTRIDRLDLSRRAPTYGMLHGDVMRMCARAGDADEIWFLDFFFCGPGWRVYDVAGFLSVVRGTPNEQQDSKSFLEGYEEVRALTPPEREALPLFEAVRAIYSLGMPARNAYHWGRDYLLRFLDSDFLASVRRTMARVESSDAR